MFERILFGKLEVWVVGLIFLVFCVAAVLFGAVVHITTKGSERFGALGEASIDTATIPENTKQVVKLLMEGNKPGLLANQQRFEERSGFVFNYPAGSKPDAGYVVVAGYDGYISRSTAELVDLNTQKTVHRWLPDYEDI